MIGMPACWLSPLGEGPQHAVAVVRGWVTAALWPDHLTLSPVRTLIIEKLTSVNWGIWNGFTHLGWNVWTGNQADLAATARRLAEVLERGPLLLTAG